MSRAIETKTQEAAGPVTLVGINEITDILVRVTQDGIRSLTFRDDFPALLISRTVLSPCVGWSRQPVLASAVIAQAHVAAGDQESRIREKHGTESRQGSDGSKQQRDHHVRYLIHGDAHACGFARTTAR